MIPAKSLNILITAGCTREPIDAVRFISNYSTGTLGYEIAKAASKKHHKVRLISGPVNLKAPEGVKVVPVETAIQMQREVNKNIDWCNCLIMSAAVADYRAKKRLSYKLKKTKDELTLKLIRNPDILKAVSRNNKDKIIVGFSLETNNLIKNAKKKLRNKKLDLIISNKKTLKSNPFGPGNGDFILIDKSLNVKQLKDISKKYLSRLLLDTIEKLCYT